MGKSFKIFNKETGQWETAASGNASGIGVTDPRLLPEDTLVQPLNEVLAAQKERLDRHDGYIAWLAEHGGGGSGGGGGTSDAVVKLTNGSITTSEGVNYLYTSQNTGIRLEYIISSSKNNKRYKISVSLDGTQIIKEQDAWTNVPGTLTIPKLDQYSSSNTHSIVVTAVDTSGFSAESYLLTIVESSIKLTSSTAGSTATVGLNYFITYTITSKVIGQEASLVVKNITNGTTKNIPLGVTTSTSPKQVNVNLWDLGTIVAGSSYTIQGQAFTTLGDATIESELVTNRAVVEDGVNLVVLVDGITTKAEVQGGASPTKFSQGGNLSFSFTPYLAGVSLIYYAVRLVHAGVTRYIGDWNDYHGNQFVQKGKPQVFSWSIPTEGDIVGNWDVTLRCWSEKGEPIVDTELVAEIVPSTQSLIPDQNPSNSRYAGWNIKQETFPSVSTQSVWNSTEPAFTAPGSLEPEGASTDLRVYDSNGILSGFLVSGGQSKLRIANESYAIIDLKPFQDDPSQLTNWSRQGFSFSCTFKTDIHPYSNRTVFFIGDYDTDGDFTEGIKVGLNDIVWSYTDGNIKETISCKIQQGVVNTVDFLVNKNEGKKVISIFVNGVLNAAREIKTDYTWRTQSKFYLGCDIDNRGFLQNHCDVEFYDIKLFRVPLNDKEVVINSMNSRARANLLETGEYDFVKYNSDKLRNFFSTTEAGSSSTLWDDVNQGYASINFNSLISDTTRTLPLDVLLINCANTGFTRAVFEEIGGTHADWYPGCTMSYFSPTSGKTSAESTTNVAVKKQGTSTMNKLIKNLDFRCDKMLKDANGQDLDYELFQPKATWMPERQFTLKADVVDSAHANNASIGKWINDSSDALFEKTPPMEYLDANRPKDTREPSKTHDEVTIKHTLEGFPIILLIQFDGEESQTMLGIYSFNLGRSSYFNMGFRFFKDFSTKIESGTSEGVYVNNPLPAFVTAYHTYSQTETFGNIDQRNVYSYEFSENANIIEDNGEKLPLALFYQDDLSVIKHVGEFKYNGANWLDPTASVTDDNVWNSLRQLFTLFAQMTGSTVQKYGWDDVSKGYKQLTGSYPAQSSWSTLASDLVDKFSIKNAYSYFLVCVTFGMVDSLGKNMTLRCWDINGTKKWFPAFYDMDTANGLDNVSLESVPKTAYIDTFKNNPDTDVNSLIISQNNADGGFDTYSSRMWDVLRDDRFTKTGVTELNYEAIWAQWRTNANLLKDPETYVNSYFAAQIGQCGELLFNYDYNVKYLTAYVGEQGGAPSYADIEALHGTRVEYVRDWLTKRWWFFDGIFSYSVADVLTPFNTKGTLACGGAESKTPTLIVTSNTPLIFVVNVGNTSDTKYFIEENKPTEIKMAAISSFNTQITINGTTQLNQITGLKEIRFQRFMSNMKLPSMSEIDLSYTETLNSSPVAFETAFVNDKGYSDIRHINLSGCKFWDANANDATFVVNIEKYTKLKTIDISNSVVTSMSLPNASLSSINITNSGIEILQLQNQPFLTSIDFTGCRKLKQVLFDSCSKIENFSLSNLGDLTGISITNCSGLKTITAVANPKLATFTVSNCNFVTSVDLSRCTSSLLSFYLVGVPAIESLNLSDTNSEYPIELAANVPNLRTLDLHGSSIKYIKFGNKVVPKYQETFVMDLSELNLTSLNLRDCGSLEYVKFDNNSTKPFDIGESFFVGCNLLTRVFGHISLKGVSTFSGCSNYYIHPAPAKVNGKTPMYEGQWYGPDTSTNPAAWKEDSNLATNITLGTTNISGAFSGTSCTIFDSYYIMYKCANVTSAVSTFSSCTKIVFTIQDSPHRDLFKNCGNLVSADNLYYATGTSEGCILYTPTRDANGEVTVYNGLFSPLKKLVNCTNMFRFAGNFYTDDYIFFKTSATQQLQFGQLYYMFNTNQLIFINDASHEWSSAPTIADYKTAKAYRLLANLPNISSISYMFYGSNIDFGMDTDANGVEFCKLFVNNTKLQTINSSFNNLRYSTGSLKNFLGGQVLDPAYATKFPLAFRGIYASFNGISVGGTLTFPIHNSMFRRCKTSLLDITTIQATNSDSTGNFVGWTKEHLPEASDEVFPYDVFKGCTILREIPGFFYQMKLKDDSTFTLPGQSWDDCKDLRNISYLYADLKGSGITYTLEGNRFKNCSLVNVSYCFSEPENTYIKSGSIPYGLFYQARLSTASIRGYSEADATSLGIDENFGISEGQWLEDSELPFALPAERTYSYAKMVKRNTLAILTRCLQNFQSINASGYSMNKGSLTPENYGDLIVENESYNIAKYIKNPQYNPAEWIDEGQTIPNPSRDIRRIIVNPSFDPYKLAWNIWAYDGISGLARNIENSSLWPAVTSGAINVSQTIPPEFSDSADELSPQGYSGIAGRQVMNYVCPPDFFRAVADGRETGVSGVFAGSGRVNSEGVEHQLYGLRGRICPYLFKPIPKITSLDNVFFRIPLINPYRWNNPDTGDYGEFISPKTFSDLLNLRNMASIFSYSVIPTRVNIPVDTFVYNLNLQDISYLFRGSRFESPSTIDPQVPAALFTRNTSLKNIAYFLASGISPGDWAGIGIKRLMPGLITQDKHKGLTNVTGAFYNNTTTVGTVPEFWNFLGSLTSANRTNVFYRMSKSLITNSASIPSTWSTGMID